MEIGPLISCLLFEKSLQTRHLPSEWKKKRKSVSYLKMVTKQTRQIIRQRAFYVKLLSIELRIQSFLIGRTQTVVLDGEYCMAQSKSRSTFGVCPIIAKCTAICGKSETI